MSQTETLTNSISAEKSSHLNIQELRSVKWVSSSYPVKQAMKTASTKFDPYYKSYPLIRGIYLFIQRIVLSVILFVNQLPLPDFLMDFVHKVDRMIENILEKTSNTIEWWWDCISVIVMRFKDVVLSTFEMFLAIGYYFLSSIKVFWIWVIGLTSQAIKLALFPLFWIIGFIGDLLNQEKGRVTEKSSSQEDEKKEVSNLNGIADKATFSRHKSAEDCHSTASSEYESDVSVVSENWSVGHPDKRGNSYNKKELRMTAEGRLREVMHRRVKNQLTLMRKNSISFSHGMASKIRQMMTPNLYRFAEIIYDRFLIIAQKLRVLELFALIEKEMSRRPWLLQMASLWISLLLTPLAILGGIFRKRRSRRSRSVRSESLRRRQRSQEKVSQGLGPSALRQSSEPFEVTEEVNQFQTMSNKTSNDQEEDLCLARDSALASSVDELPSSDGGEGITNLTEQVIKEEMEVESSEDKENIIVYPTQAPQDSLKEERAGSQPRILITEEKQEGNILPKEKSVEINNERNYAKALTTERVPTSSQGTKDAPLTPSLKSPRRKSSPGYKRKSIPVVHKEVSEILFSELDDFLRNRYSYTSILSSEESKMRRREKGQKRIFFSL